MDPQLPSTDDGLPICDECGFPSDPYRGQLTKLLCHNRWRWLHWACRLVLNERMAGKL
jgi:hypothetical protein